VSKWDRSTRKRRGSRKKVGEDAGFTRRMKGELSTSVIKNGLKGRAVPIGPVAASSAAERKKFRVPDKGDVYTERAISCRKREEIPGAHSRNKKRGRPVSMITQK